MSSERERSEVLKRFGATDSEAAKLLEYNCNDFDVESALGLNFPLEDETFIQAWREYAADLVATLQPMRSAWHHRMEETLARDPNTPRMHALLHTPGVRLHAQPANR